MRAPDVTYKAVSWFCCARRYVQSPFVTMRAPDVMCNVIWHPCIHACAKRYLQSGFVILLRQTLRIKPFHDHACSRRHVQCSLASMHPCVRQTLRTKRFRDNACARRYLQWCGNHACVRRCMQSILKSLRAPNLHDSTQSRAHLST